MCDRHGVCSLARRSEQGARVQVRRASALVAGVLLVAACSSEEPLREPVAAPSASLSGPAAPSAVPSLSAVPSPSPSPSPAPLSAFEADPAVQGLRGFTSGWYLVAPGGAPRSADEVLANTYAMMLEGDVWQVDRISDAPGLACAAVPIVRRPA